MRRSKPRIGLTASENAAAGLCQIPAAYQRALLFCGALPLLLPLELSRADCAQLSRDLDGFLFSGGPDIHPFYFGEETLEGCADQSQARDRTELRLFAAARQKKKPILAVCRGAQLVNIALGGVIWQDLGFVSRPLPIAHRQPFSPSRPSHHVSLTDGSLLARILGETRLAVNSAHHQAIRRAAPGLRVSALAPDGIIEAVEAADGSFLIGVQWHPELLLDSQPHARRLFRAFADRCQNTP